MNADNDYQKIAKSWQTVNVILGIAIIGLNLFLIPGTASILMTSGGTWGLGYYFLMVTIPAHLFLVSGIAALTKRFRGNPFVLMANISCPAVYGLMYLLGWIGF